VRTKDVHFSSRVAEETTEAARYEAERVLACFA